MDDIMYIITAVLFFFVILVFAVILDTLDDFTGGILAVLVVEGCRHIYKTFNESVSKSSSEPDEDEL